MFEPPKPLGVRSSAGKNRGWTGQVVNIECGMSARGAQKPGAKDSFSQVAAGENNREKGNRKGAEERTTANGGDGRR